MRVRHSKNSNNTYILRVEYPFGDPLPLQLPVVILVLAVAFVVVDLRSDSLETLSTLNLHSEVLLQQVIVVVLEPVVIFVLLVTFLSLADTCGAIRVLVFDLAVINQVLEDLAGLVLVWKQ